jgi:hypothetical protein
MECALVLLSSAMTRKTTYGLIQLPRIPDARGNLTFIEQRRQVPFEIKRVYYVYDVPGGSSRGGHAHKALEQFIIAANGSFDVALSDGENTERFHLNRSYCGLYIPPMTWRELDNFSSGSVCLVLASEMYDEDDYIRDYDVFCDECRRRVGDSRPPLTVESVSSTRTPVQQGVEGSSQPRR